MILANRLAAAVFLCLVATLACVMVDGEAEFSPERAYAEVTLALGDLESAEAAFPEDEFVAKAVEVLESVQLALNIYINGGGEGDSLMTALAAAQTLVDVSMNDEDYKVYALVMDIALRRVRAALPEAV